jgi:hypothetical protein
MGSSTKCSDFSVLHAAEAEGTKDIHGDKGDGWIGVDLDATLAKYDGWKSADHIGEPIPAMVDRVSRADEMRAMRDISREEAVDAAM